MQLFVGPADALGHLWVIRIRGSMSEEPIVEPDSRAEVVYTSHAELDTAVVRALCAGRCVSVLEPEASFRARVERVAATLEELGIVSEWRWTSTHHELSTSIDDERSALTWFLSHSAEVLFVGVHAFEKRQRTSVRPPRRLGAIG